MRFFPTVRLGVSTSILTAFLFAAVVVSSPVAHAATFVVNSTDWGYDGVCDADCTLIDAILEAEALPDADEIILQPCETYTLFFIHEVDTGTPQIYTPITIHGNGATIQRFPSAPDFRLFLVRPSGNLTLDRLTIRWGKVMNGGAGLFNMGTLTVLNSIVENNSTYSDADILLPGGGIYNTRGELTVEHSTVRNNTSVRGAGIYSNATPTDPSTVTIRNSSIVNNQAIDGSIWSVGGGLLITDDTTVTISDTTISGNYALYRGGGVLLYGIPPAYTVSFRNVTITDNEAELYRAGGIDEQTCGITCIDPTDPLVENSIIANNTAPDFPDWVGEYVSGGNNIIGVGLGSFPTTTGDQTVTTLADVGPLVELGQAGGQHHRLLFGNPGIDAGNSSLCATTDQIDLTRQGADCEIGAVEYRECIAAPSDLDAWWSFDEFYGGVREDSAGAVANDGSLTGTAPPGTGMVDGAVCFYGPSPQAIVAPDDDELDFFGDCTGTTDDLTIDVWVKTAAHGLQSIVDKRESASGFLRGYHMYILDGRLGFQLATGAGTSACGVGGSACDDYVSPVPTPGDVDLRDDRWHFVAVSVDRCAGGLGRMYIDGDLVHTFTPRVGDIANSADLQIGERYPVPTAATFKGCLDELEIFDRALTEAELDAIYDAGWAGKCKGECAETNYPTCGGMCPDGDRCVPNDATEHCECVTDPIPCSESEPVCDGDCPPSEECVTDAVGGCRCEPIPPCSESEAPECAGLCPDANEVCVSVAGQNCFCANPQSIPCGDSETPTCGGFCDVQGETCRYITGEDTCECVPEVVECADAVPPLCIGACDLGKSCKPGMLPTDPCECKFCLVAKPSGWTTVSLPSKKDVWWTELECAATYNLYQSTHSLYVDADDDGLADDYGGCLESGIEIPLTEDNFTPPAGWLRHYLVTGVNPVGEGDLGYASNVRERPNGSPCP